MLSFHMHFFRTLKVSILLLLFLVFYSVLLDLNARVEASHAAACCSGAFSSCRIGPVSCKEYQKRFADVRAEARSLQI